MREGAAAWEPLELRDDALELRVCEPCEARVLAQELLASKPVVARVFARGQLRRGDAALARGAALAAGDVLTLAFEASEPAQVKSDAPVDVVYRDRVLLAVDKPAGVLVHGDGTDAETLAARVQGLLARAGVAAVAQPVQRLDVETTGLVLFSLTKEFQPALDAQVAGHEMRKRYLAVVEGRLSRAESGWAELDGPIARDRHDARRMRVGRTGKPALTRVRTLAARAGRSLLEVELVTGRKHQIRVHLATAGHPILGDALYGGKRHAAGLMLHAWREEVLHPVTGERVSLRTAVPARFSDLFPEPDWRSACDGQAPQSRR